MDGLGGHYVKVISQTQRYKYHIFLYVEAKKTMLT
jgi:hypothetical protein